MNNQQLDQTVILWHKRSLRKLVLILLNIPKSDSTDYLKQMLYIVMLSLP